MKKIDLYTDGSCKPSNPGFAGFGVAVVVDGLLVDTISSYIGEGTNNIAELMAVDGALTWLKENDLSGNIESWTEDPEEVITIYTDSQYVVGLFTKNWNPKVNKELISSIRNKLKGFLNIRFEWIRGHNGSEFNELADELANQAVDNKDSVTIKHCCENMEKEMSSGELIIFGLKDSHLDIKDFEHTNSRLYMKGAENKVYDIFYCPWCGKKVQEKL